MYIPSLPALACLSSVLHLSSAFTITQPPSNALPLSSYVVHQFPNPTWVENIAVRSSGQLLLTIVTTPDVYYLDPVTPSTASLLARFPSSGVVGVTEVKPDHFYVLTSNFSLATLSLGLGSNTVQSIDLTAYHPTSNTGAVVKTVAALPKIQFGNGMSTLDASKDLIIIADSIAGALWLLNVQTGEYRILLQEPEMVPPPVASGFPLGINGVHVLPISRDEVYIYFDNTNGHLFCRVPLSLSTLTKTGPVEILANLTSSGLMTDDFALDPEEGVAYLASQGQNQILRLPLGGGRAVDVLGGLNQTVVAGPTSVALARGDGCEGKIYVTTNGGIFAPVNGTFTEGGKVVAVDTTGWK